jgi:hypothetical protein
MVIKLRENSHLEKLPKDLKEQILCAFQEEDTVSQVFIIYFVFLSPPFRRKKGDIEIGSVHLSGRTTE